MKNRPSSGKSVDTFLPVETKDYVEEYLGLLNIQELDVLLQGVESLEEFLLLIRSQAQQALLSEDDVKAGQLVAFLNAIQHDQGIEFPDGIPDNVVRGDFC